MSYVGEECTSVRTYREKKRERVAWKKKRMVVERSRKGGIKDGEGKGNVCREITRKGGREEERERNRRRRRWERINWVVANVSL